VWFFIRYRREARVREWEELMSSFFESGSWDELQELYTLTPGASTNCLPPLYEEGT